MVSPARTGAERYQSAIPDIFTPDDLESMRRFYGSIQIGKLATWIDSRLRTYELGDRQYRMLVDIPLDWDGVSLVGTFTEFATAMPLRFAAKSQLTRDMVNPRAALLAQPSTAGGEKNMNYSPQERHTLASGNLRPVADRILHAVEHNFNGQHPEVVTLSGASQGATVALAYGADDRTPASAVSAIEVPTVVRRSLPQLGFDFATSGNDLAAVVRSNYADHTSEMARRTEIDTELLQLMKYGAHAITPDEIATAASLRYPTAPVDIYMTLGKGGSVVHSWGVDGNVSPAAANEVIAEAFKGQPLYEAHPLEGISHTVIDLYGINAALARQAARILHR